VHSKTSTYKKTLHDFKAFEQRCYKSESVRCHSNPWLRPPAPPPRPPLPNQQSSSEYQWCGLQKEEDVGTETKRACTVVCIFFFIIFLVVQSQCDLGHIFPLKVKQRKDVKKKAMWNVQCIEEWRTSFMTSPPASPVQWLENKSKKKVLLGFIIIILCSSKGKCAESYFLLTAKDFSPEFLFSSAWFCQSWSLPRDLACQTCLQ